MELWKYNTYEEYVQIQKRGNKKKQSKIWVLEDSILFLSDYIEHNIGTIWFGLCHGTRRGEEQKWFRKYLHCDDVIGTEIADTAEQYPYTIQWDFHETKPEWINAVDFIYSNSFDHSYDPEKCINAWMDCIKEGGVCILEHTPEHIHATELDPFGAKLSIMPYLILKWSQGRFCVREILTHPNRRKLRFLIIRHNT